MKNALNIVGDLWRCNIFNDSCVVDSLYEIKKLVLYIFIVNAIKGVLSLSAPCWDTEKGPDVAPYIRIALTHWGRVMHICVSKLTIIGSDKGLSPGRRQALIWTNAGILLIGPLGTNFSENFVEIYRFSFKKLHLKMSSGNWRPFCLCLSVLKC